MGPFAMDKEVLQEDSFRKEMTREFGLQMPNHHLSYIESHQTTPGIPDLHLFFAAYGDLWLELKVVKAPRDTVTVRPTQKNWHRKRHEAGGKSWFATLDTNGDILLTPGRVAIGLSTAAAVWRAASSVHRMSNLHAMIGEMQ